MERNQLISPPFPHGGELRVQFHLQEEQALEYAEDPHVMLRAYVGHSGLDAAPAAQGAERPRVVRFPMVPDLCLEPDYSKVWAMAMRRLSPLHQIMSHAPAQPSLN